MLAKITQILAVCKGMVGLTIHRVVIHGKHPILSMRFFDVNQLCVPVLYYTHRSCTNTVLESTRFGNNCGIILGKSKLQVKELYLAEAPILQPQKTVVTLCGWYNA